MAKTRDPNTAPGEDSLHGDSADEADGRRKTIDDEGADAAPDNIGDVAPPDWLGIARDAYEDSTEYVESSLKVQWERNERAFQNRHQSGSIIRRANHPAMNHTLQIKVLNKTGATRDFLQYIQSPG